MSDDRDPSVLLGVAHEWLDETDRIALTHFAGELTITAKHDRTLVTQADTEVETRLRERIADAHPTHAVVGEELGSAADAGHGRWVIDPIDATHNFVRGIEVFAGELTITAKHDSTLVTQADTEIETRLRERIADAHPAHAVVGEELGSAADAGHGRWVIDPIDATHNFVRGIEVFATLLAFERDGELELGIVSAPAMRRRWWATRGGGAHVRGDGVERRLRVSAVDALDQAQILFSTLRGLDAAGLGGALHRITALAWRDRGFGDFWGHMLVAQGSAEAMLEYGVKPWDMAAPHVIITEAGGRMTDLAGRPSWSGPQVLTTNGALHDRLLELLEGR